MLDVVVDVGTVVVTVEVDVVVDVACVVVVVGCLVVIRIGFLLMSGTLFFGGNLLIFLRAGLAGTGAVKESSSS